MCLLGSNSLLCKRGLVMLKKRWTLAIAVLMWVSAGLPASAQPLADRVPADALIYVGWTGSETLGPGFEASKLKRILDESSLPEVISDLLPRVIKKLAEENPQTAELDEETALMLAVTSNLWKYPAAFYFGPTVDREGVPQPQMALIFGAGDDAEELEKKLAELTGEVPPPGVVVRRNQSTIVIGTGNLSENHLNVMGVGRIRSLPPPGSRLSENESFRQSLSQGLPNPVMVSYIDIEATFADVDRAAEQWRELGAELPAPMAMLPMLRPALGLDGLKRAISTVGFDGADWGMRLFVEAPAPRRGLLAFLDYGPMDRRAFEVIPATAVLAGGFQVDLARLLKETRDVGERLEPGMVRQLNQMLGEVGQMLGVNLESDVFEALGPEWVFYADPMSTGEFPLGVVLANRLRDAEKFKGAHDKLIALANSLVAEQMRDQPGEITVRTSRVKDKTIYHLGLPILSLSWTIEGEHLIAALSPEVLIGALDRPAGWQNISQTMLIEMQRRLQVRGPAGFLLVDTARSMPRSYPMMSMLARFPVGLAEILGMEDTPVTVLPPLSRIMPMMTPAGAFSFADDRGFHFRAVEPWPGATLQAVARPEMVQVTAPLMVGVLLPALGQARITAKRTVSLSNARQLVVGIAIFRAEHNDRFPLSLGELVTQGIIQPSAPSAFISPFETAPPPPLRGDPTPAEQALWVDQNSSYVYLRPDAQTSARVPDSQIPLVYDRAMLQAGKPGTVVGFADGHAEYMLIENLPEVIRQREGLDRQAPRPMGPGIWGEITPPPAPR